MRTPALAIEPNRYLDALVSDFLMFGGKIVIRKFDTPRDLMSLPEPVVVNCTGLGSFTLFDDKELVPIKGQLTALVAQPEVNYRAGGRTASGGNASMNSRSDGIIVGNLQDRGNWSLDPDPDVIQRNVQAAIDFFSLMRPPAPGRRLTRSEPPQTVPDVNAFFDAQSWSVTLRSTPTERSPQRHRDTGIKRTGHAQRVAWPFGGGVKSRARASTAARDMRP